MEIMSGESLYKCYIYHYEKERKLKNFKMNRNLRFVYVCDITDVFGILHLVTVQVTNVEENNA